MINMSENLWKNEDALVVIQRALKSNGNFNRIHPLIENMRKTLPEDILPEFERVLSSIEYSFFYAGKNQKNNSPLAKEARVNRYMDNV